MVKARPGTLENKAFSESLALRFSRFLGGEEVTEGAAERREPAVTELLADPEFVPAFFVNRAERVALRSFANSKSA